MRVGSTSRGSPLQSYPSWRSICHRLPNSGGLRAVRKNYTSMCSLPSTLWNTHFPFLNGCERVSSVRRTEESLRPIGGNNALSSPSRKCLRTHLHPSSPRVEGLLRSESFSAVVEFL